MISILHILEGGVRNVHLDQFQGGLTSCLYDVYLLSHEAQVKQVCCIYAVTQEEVCSTLSESDIQHMNYCLRYHLVPAVNTNVLVYSYISRLCRTAGHLSDLLARLHR